MHGEAKVKYQIQKSTGDMNVIGDIPGDKKVIYCYQKEMLQCISKSLPVKRLSMHKTVVSLRQITVATDGNPRKTQAPPVMSTRFNHM